MTLHEPACSELNGLLTSPGYVQVAEQPEEPEVENNDCCMLCETGGNLLCCDACPAAYHMRCIGESAKSLPDGEWLCAECAMGGRGVSLTRCFMQTRLSCVLLAIRAAAGRALRACRTAVAVRRVRQRCDAAYKLPQLRDEALDSCWTACA